MSDDLNEPWTQERFFAWAEAQDPGYEFDGVRPVLMTGWTLRHSAIGGDLRYALDTRLDGTGCQALGPGAGVETINKTVRYPDAFVTCSEVDGDAHLVPGVVVVFEVVSPSSGQIDRIVKVREYAAVPSIRRYVIADSNFVGLTVLERNHADDPWTHSVLTGDDTLRIPEVGVEFPVAEIYERVVFPDEKSISA
jgi:Uma2 family endonuclease